MKIYTRTGDDGSTALFGGGRVAKAHPRVAAYGDVDELNAVLGWALTQISSAETAQRIQVVQHDLFTLGAELATPPAAAGRKRPETPPLPTARVAEMEEWIDDAERELAPLHAFVLPGGSAAAAALHVARTVCRRAERAVVALGAAETVPPEALVYLNRLSDLLFTLARLENRRAGCDEVLWEHD
jgi:cob(I)alamin adenosyltransferase